MATRKKPFSAKQKKAQLQDKRARNRDKAARVGAAERGEAPPVVAAVAPKPQVVRTEGPLQLIREINGLRTVFAREPDEAVAQRKLASQQPVATLTRAQWEREPLAPAAVLGMPRRPPWSADMTKQELDKRELDAFSDWVADVYARAERHEGELNFFEHNLDVWRQLWRAIEMGDVLLICCDVRWPSFTFPYALLEYARDCGRPVVLTLTKTDMVAAAVAQQWEAHFRARFPHLRVALTNAFPAADDAPGDRIKSKKGQKRKALKRNPVSREAILTAAREALGWTGATDEKPFFTISAVGAPNAGKSAVINLLVEAHKVAVSATPGKTKHFQTHFVSDECRLLDSPGLMFPFVAPHCRTMQAIIGNFPVSQMREPFTAVGFLLRRLNLPAMYGLSFPFDADDDEPLPPPGPLHVWSPYEVCEALAAKRGFRSKGGSLDVYRSGKAIIAEALRGTLKTLYWLPPAEAQLFPPPLPAADAPQTENGAPQTQYTTATAGDQ